MSHSKSNIPCIRHASTSRTPYSTTQNRSKRAKTSGTWRCCAERAWSEKDKTQWTLASELDKRCTEILDKCRGVVSLLYGRLIAGRMFSDVDADDAICMPEIVIARPLEVRCHPT
ncbi:hypothetical protein CONLIGDRAFT_686743 [Coniochaeta ligniaria NRRL 30616]|uniref:Uncharacterized protein n=1 Tax=Coniochaeta ligniaria NRRL 30616 TaxID=1408157 RepID=A0A1J7J725_9PEZI|nr:hypothetical protein CONLIGDRAFT_686743 [Coniochaeta ligniaria NRRL 30616]